MSDDGTGAEVLPPWQGSPDVVLGLDPGLGTTGFGVVRRLGPGRAALLGYGTIKTAPGTPDPDRLFELHRDMRALLDRYRPAEVAVEKIFFKKNQTTGIQVAQARGVLLLSLGERNLVPEEYSPVEVKAAVAGYGNAGKAQVQEMVRRLLKMDARPRPDDAADALAVALCRVFRSRVLAGVRRAGGNRR